MDWFENLGKGLDSLVEKVEKEVKNNKILQEVVRELKDPANLFKGGTDAFKKTFDLFANNDPAKNREVVKKLAEFRKLDCDEISDKDIAQTMVNFIRTWEGFGHKANSERIDSFEKALAENTFAASNYDNDWQVECNSIVDQGVFYHIEMRKFPKDTQPSAQKEATTEPTPSPLVQETEGFTGTDL